MSKEKKIAIAIMAVALVIVGSLVAHMIHQNHLYTQAKLCLENGDYEQAEALFLKLDDYKDSQDMVQETTYRKAVYKKENKEFEESIALFQSVQDYKDSNAMIRETNYLFGIDLFEKKEYDKAIEQFQKVTLYQDAEERLKEAYYQRGLFRMVSQNFADAVTDFEKVGEYKDAKEQLIEANYQSALSFMKKGEYAQAIALFEKIGDYKDVNAQITEANYQSAVKMLNNNASEAREKLIALGNYKDAESLLKNIKPVIAKKIEINYSFNTNTTTVYSYDQYGVFISGDATEREGTRGGQGGENSQKKDSIDPNMHCYQRYTPNGILEEARSTNGKYPDIRCEIIKDNAGRPIEVNMYNKGEKSYYEKYQWNEKNQLIRGNAQLVFKNPVNATIKLFDENTGAIYSTFAYDNDDNLIEISNFGISDNKLISKTQYTYKYIYCETQISSNSEDLEIKYRVRKSADDAKSQIGAFAIYDNAKQEAIKHKDEGYKVYDMDGNLIYAP